MTFFTQGKPSRKRSVYGHNTGTSTETVYTCPANCVAEVTFIQIHNSTGNTNIEIDIVGEGSLKDKLETTALQYGVKVNFLGTLDFFELNDLYKDYKIFVSSSIF